MSIRTHDEILKEIQEIVFFTDYSSTVARYVYYLIDYISRSLQPDEYFNLIKKLRDDEEIWLDSFDEKILTEVYNFIIGGESIRNKFKTRTL